MAKFIEVHNDSNGSPVMVNLDWVEEITDGGDKGASIYFSFNYPTTIEQDYIDVLESYEEIREQIASLQGFMPKKRG